MKNEIRILRSADVKAMLPPRKAVSNKGTYGKAAILAGSMQYSGAAVLAAQGALCGGAGYVALCVPKKLKTTLIGRLPEAILLDLCPGGAWKFRPKKLKTILQYNAIAAGMGMGNTKNTAKIIAFLLKNYEGKLLIDADGINALARFYGAYGAAELFKAKKCAALITPHPLEFARLTEIDNIALSENDGERAIEEAKKYAAANGVTVLLKGVSGAKTLIAGSNNGKNGEKNENVAFNATGNSGQAKGGSGDTLAGVIAAIAASGADLFSAACAGAYLAGKAAEIAAKQTSEYALTATKIAEHIGKAILDL